MWHYNQMDHEIRSLVLPQLGMLKLYSYVYPTEKQPTSPRPPCTATPKTCERALQNSHIGLAGWQGDL